MKRPKGGRVSAKQQYVHEQLRDAGIRVAVIRSRDELCSVLDEIEQSQRKDAA